VERDGETYTIDTRVLPGMYRLWAYKPGYQTRWWDGEPLPPTFAPFTGYAVDIVVDGTGAALTADLALGRPRS
jgi:hypothetical protein